MARWKAARPTALAPAPDAALLAARLLAWYDRHARILPWRARPGERADPYRVWLSEIMLQQTTVAAVGPYFHRVLARWPTVEALAGAPLDEVLGVWAGLGYYARARNLHKCARVVAAEHRGRFPDTEEGLRGLPGIGPYTAAAIAAIAFDRPAVVVDGNVERVMARLFAIKTPLPAAKPELRAAAASISPAQRPGDFAQATMDLGATICTPRSPLCMLCPWADACAAHLAGIVEELPRRSPKAERPVKQAVAFVLRQGDTVWLRRRPDDGLLGGMLEAPSTPWRSEACSAATARRLAPVTAKWTKAGRVVHGFTHFIIEFDVWTAEAADGGAPDEGRWYSPSDLGRAALPTMTKRVLQQALGATAPARRKRR
ncbi:MAG: A/G-specific adenine glycosylase [Alphaproteobacteria bacterium]|nr:A/G-specific adenine glycosylase [Alphaproteobacteria bacterium]